MRYLILSDIHSNFQALNAILTDMPESNYDQIIVLGDIIGYNAEPNLVIDLLRKLSEQKKIRIALRGNHDKALLDTSMELLFNSRARTALQWTRETLSIQNVNFLSTLKDDMYRIDGLYYFVHGSIFNPNEYLHKPFNMIDSCDEISSKGYLGCFFGHTHRAGLYIRKKDDIGEEPVKIDFQDNYTEYSLHPGEIFLVNPGSVGQPRDSNPMSSCMIFNNSNKKMEFYRFNYNIQQAQENILKADLPKILAERLKTGT